MDIYNIKDTYIEFIRAYDNRVADNKNESRPYIGIILLIGDVKYYAPFTSPKPKHRRMHNDKDFRKIDGGRLPFLLIITLYPLLHGTNKSIYSLAHDNSSTVAWRLCLLFLPIYFNHLSGIIFYIQYAGISVMSSNFCVFSFIYFSAFYI